MKYCPLIPSRIIFMSMFSYLNFSNLKNMEIISFNINLNSSAKILLLVKYWNLAPKNGLLIKQL